MNILGLAKTKMFLMINEFMMPKLSKENHWAPYFFQNSSMAKIGPIKKIF
jgi:hypothetical protein